MMKIITFSIIALSLCCILQSCSKGSRGPETTGPDPLRPEITVLWTGEDSVITIKDFPKINKAVSSDEKVVKVVIKDSGIKLSAGVPGSAVIHITDDENRAVTREVHSMNLNYTWRNRINDPAYKTTVVVKANDPALVENLENQLLLEASIPYAIDFRPDMPEKGTDSFRQITNSSPSVITTGTFIFRDLILELNFTSSTKRYKVIPVKNREMLGLELDLTEHYKVLHPDKGIQKIIVVHYVKRNIQPG